MVGWSPDGGGGGGAAVIEIPRKVRMPIEGREVQINGIRLVCGSRASQRVQNSNHAALSRSVSGKMAESGTPLRLTFDPL
jgi:hypothetical protein